MPGENLRKQVWTGNQMHIRRRDWESNPGPLVHSAGEEPLRYLLPQASPLVDSYDPPESIGTKKSTNIPCMTPQ